MSAAVERAEHPRRSLPGPDIQDAVYSAELFDPAGELRILHRGQRYRLRVGTKGALELLGPISAGMHSFTARPASHPTARHLA
ncbi:hemin uptake protein HemP [Thiocapsa roseopersicina]|uniref:Hemin uptake protein hemP n=1 Tax=Thiocapsa roseopersicina TaxID=1058 RepID=A0A1H3D2D6_THIRO|nr:hemin uptake protein HemP [Thiocapsa roseopersicina]SDX60288.1 Hemin uptake protein hemP [Thiocapsa roseopersicina]